MDKEEYRLMYDLEETHWWYVGMRKIYFNLLNKFYKKNTNLSILDVGCGTGLLLEYFKVYGMPVGVDISCEALYFSQQRDKKRILRASVMDLPFLDNSFDLVSASGLIYHLQVKGDILALKECYRVLKENSRIILSAPAYNFLKSRHDKACHTSRRYTKRELKAKMEKAGFKIEKITYANTVLFPLIALIRLAQKMDRRKNMASSDIAPTPAFANGILKFILAIEAKLIKKINFPFGLSILCVARK